ncbi:MAG: LemA family protein [Gammaproteobacteria bacterium]|nr:LemA family protein [Gammaproteobacteria bacterium]
MDTPRLIFLLFSATAVIYAILIYNRLISLKHNVKKAWGNIDVLLKQRHDELPKLIATCKQYMQHEQETLRQVTEARSRVAKAQSRTDMPALDLAEDQLRAGLGQLFAVVENYPELKADEHFQHLQGRISNLENTISDRREFYNEVVNINNIRIEQFPDLLIAHLFHFEPHRLLSFRKHEIKDINVQQLFKG